MTIILGAGGLWADGSEGGDGSIGRTLAQHAWADWSGHGTGPAGQGVGASFLYDTTDTADSIDIVLH